MPTNTPFQVGLIGFSAFERSAFESFFRLSARRSPSYVRTDTPEQADAILLDTDNPQALIQLPESLRERTLGVGQHELPGGLGVLPRPINMMAIMRILDTRLPQMLQNTPTRREAGSSIPQAAANTPTSTQLSREDYLAALASLAADHQERPQEQILVVDDSDIALRFMAQHLHRYGLQVTLCHSGEEALDRVAAHRYAFVFMDVNMNGMDGYTACRRIKQQPYSGGRSAPAVVMLTSRSGTFDKLRGTLAGCDAYLTKPLQEAALLRVIGDYFDSGSAQKRRHG